MWFCGKKILIISSVVTTSCWSSSMACAVVISQMAESHLLLSAMCISECVKTRHSTQLRERAVRCHSGQAQGPSVLTPSDLDLCSATGPLVHLVPASRGKLVHVSGSQNLVYVSHNQKAIVLDSSHSMLYFSYFFWSGKQHNYYCS